MLDAATRDALRKPFQPNEISKLPGTAKRPPLDYVGHAAVTNRLNNAAPDWTYTIERVEVRGSIERVGDERRFVSSEDGLPHVVAVFGTMTIGGVTRQEVGEVDSFTTYGLELKNAISDFIRRGAMRFGVALDLWSKEDLFSEPPSPVATAPGGSEEGAGTQTGHPAPSLTSDAGADSPVENAHAFGEGAERAQSGKAPASDSTAPGDLLEQATNLYKTRRSLVAAAAMLWEPRSEERRVGKEC